MHHSKRTASLLLLFSFFALATFFSCKKETESKTPPAPVDYGNKVATTVSGFVTDEHNAPVAGITAIAGSQSAVTDEFGYFSIKNVQLAKNAAVVTVEKAGYFKCIKTYIATANKGAFFRMKLVPKTIAGSVNAAAGGNVSLPNGLAVSLPANGFVNAATKAAYSGTVNVAAHFLDPTSNDIIATMPGDLRGVDENNQIKLLTSFGMAAVELTGAGGELLQLAENKQATLTFPIPASLNSKAPATIPLWYFDETNGVWKQEGTATKTGNNYVGAVSHFSFWNCDVPAVYVEFSCIVTDTAGRPLQNVFVKITDVNIYGMGGGWTDSTGFIAGPLPDNSQLKLEVFSEPGCAAPMYTRDITTSGSNISLGTIVVNSPNMSIIKGSLYNCNGMPVTNGCIIISTGIYRRINVTDGTFSYTENLCASTTGNASIVCVDYTTNQQGNPENIYYTAGESYDFGSFYACGNNSAEFVNYTVNGNAYSCAPPVDTLISSVGPYILINSPGQPYRMQLSIHNTIIEYLQIRNVAAGLPMTSSFQRLNNTTVNITEDGNGFVAGNFSGTFSYFSAGEDPITFEPIYDSLPYNISLHFRVRQ